MMSPASGIKREVCQLVDQQIQTLREKTPLTSSDLLEYHTRSEKITMLYEELDRITRATFKGQTGRAS
jgi:hypothetical protein